MNKKGIIIGVILAIALAGGFYYRFTHLATGAQEEKAQSEIAAPKEKSGDKNEIGADIKNDAPKTVSMTQERQKQYGVVVAAAKQERLAEAISVTGKVEVNGDRIAHVSPRIPGKIAAVSASLGDSIASGQVLVMLDSVELDEAINRYRQSTAKLSLAKNNLERVNALVRRKLPPARRSCRPRPTIR